MGNIVEQLDSQVASLLADWSISTTILAVLIVGLLISPLLFPEEPDTHPLLLARQASAGAIRNKGESAAYRSPEVPHGYPLKSGLNVKEDGAPRWAGGKNGDLWDIWREVLRSGKAGSDGTPLPKGLIMTVLGKEEVIEHDIEQINKEINIIGTFLANSGAKRVAIYLPNSIEFLVGLFACSFYGVTPILLPFNQSHPKVYELVSGTGADALICAAGTLPLEELSKACPQLRLVTWVVQKSSRQMDWSGQPKAAEGKLKVGVWHEMTAESTGDIQLPTNADGKTPTDVTVVWQHTDPAVKPEIVNFTHENLVSAIAALISAVPLRQRLSPADLVLPADSFTHSYALCMTLGALFMHASIVINSVAVPGVDLALARRGAAPTVIIASAETLAALHRQETAGVTSLAQNLGRYTQAQTMSAGRMPTDGLLFKLLAPSSTKHTPGKLRLIFVSERLGGGSPPITSTMLSDLRLFTRSRIIYALTAAKVAGAVAQSNVFDYRRDDGIAHSHFGIPLSSVEVKLTNRTDSEVATNEPRGELLISGPAVQGGKAKLDARARIRADCTLAYA